MHAHTNTHIHTPHTYAHTLTHTTHTHIYTHTREALKDLAANRCSILVAALEKSKHFLEAAGRLPWLADAEKVYAVWKPCAHCQRPVKPRS